MNKLVLFDIDGTLVACDNKDHLDSFTYAINSVWKKEVVDINDIDHSGKTDTELIIELLQREGLSKEEISSRINETTREMGTFFKKSVSQKNIQPLEGTGDLLEELQRKNVLLGLVTGNVESIAKEKLNKAGLLKYFKVGGFGGDYEKRADLIKTAIDEVKEEFDFKVKDNVFVVGDTPRDITSGKEVDVKTIAVSTGNYSTRELKKENPDFLFESLIFKEEITRAILNDC